MFLVILFLLSFANVLNQSPKRYCHAFCSNIWVHTWALLPHLQGIVLGLVRISLPRISTRSRLIHSSSNCMSETSSSFSPWWWCLSRRASVRVGAPGQPAAPPRCARSGHRWDRTRPSMCPQAPRGRCVRGDAAEPAASAAPQSREELGFYSGIDWTESTPRSSGSSSITREEERVQKWPGGLKLIYIYKGGDRCLTGSEAWQLKQLRSFTIKMNTKKNPICACSQVPLVTQTSWPNQIWEHHCGIKRIYHLQLFYRKYLM